VTPVAGYPDRDETIARYELLTGRTVGDLRWFEMLCAFVLTVTVIRMADIGVAGGRLPPDNRMGHGNLTAQMLARWLDLPVPELDAAYAARRGLGSQR
jgi:aminoglycoside phosphotransferase (APT) family kinase protein